MRIPMPDAVPPLSYADAAAAAPRTELYFEILLEQARLAGVRGNYPIAAAVVVRREGDDHVYVASNAMFESNDPTAHAEITAIRHALHLERLTVAAETRERPRTVNPATRPHIVLYSTLEPCPMCAVCALTAQVDQIVVAVPDSASGALSPDRVAGLAPIWTQLARGVDIRFCQSRDPTDQVTYLPSPLLDALEKLASHGRSLLDKRVLLGDCGDVRAPHSAS
jgi:tRNA(adenine34) deaminase